MTKTICDVCEIKEGKKLVLKCCDQHRDNVVHDICPECLMEVLERVNFESSDLTKFSNIVTRLHVQKNAKVKT